MGYFAGDSAWVVDGKLNVDQGRKDYMDLCIDLYQNDMTAYVASWSTTWYQGMSGAIPVIDASTDVWNEEQMEEASESGNTTEVFAYGLPSWGVLTMREPPLQKNLSARESRHPPGTVLKPSERLHALCIRLFATAQPAERLPAGHPVSTGFVFSICTICRRTTAGCQ